MTPIPGCSGTGTLDDDYCVIRLPNMLVIVGDNGVPSRAFPLQECEGDCDTDEDCDLDLICQLRDDVEEVQGCIGNGESGKDYCKSLLVGPTPKPTRAPSRPPTRNPTNLPSSSPTAITKCILITTGTGTFDGGYLDVFVNIGDGYNMMTTPGVNYVKGQVVLDECYVGLLGVQVTNAQTNAWGGRIEYSINDQSSYSAMICDDCTGTVETTEYIVVDGNSDGSGDTKCLNGNIGNICTLSAPDPTLAPTSSLAPTSAPDTFTPGELTVSCDNGKLLLSTVSTFFPLLSYK